MATIRKTSDVANQDDRYVHIIGIIESVLIIEYWSGLVTRIHLVGN